MNLLYDLLLYLFPWLIVFGFIMLCFKLTIWVKGGKRSAIALGFVLQTFLPNPNVERRIDVLVKQEQTDEDNNNTSKDDW
ncbi:MULTISPECIES: hypothetical protein [Idiomarina]|jgi:hypothetical protein|uniref:hypothetical protein n=1 Tax=Idiomarina TaxID=135575 RepID=UPI000C0AE7DA|nr:MULTISPECIES: hypothetical protein [Idiomarina]MAL83888.1 hypothetical protein [Idiomarina sp.]MAO66959.1 hypothetical protein [Idiomarina sp.]MBF81603.1 hypothetical protein [Idiomarina sp.]|tara:strand:- start:4380 stop:4619 length:240 start_codon:yes stop_codon:yes gene_type:complete